MTTKMKLNRMLINGKIYLFLLYQFINLVLGTVLMPFTMGYIYFAKKMDASMIRLIIKTSYIASFKMLEMSIWATETLFFQSFQDFANWQQWKAWELTNQITNSYRSAMH